MDPSTATIATWNSDATPATVATLMQWAGISGNLKRALLEDLGCEEDEHYRGLAALAAEAAQETIDELLVPGDGGGRAPTKMQAAKCYCLFRAARVAAGIQRTAAEEKDAQAKTAAAAAPEVVG